jgi:tRNA(Ile)-lysidine synthase TilS/MesJ
MNDSIIFDQSTVALLMQCADPVVIAVSGGPDSMCLATLIRDFWLEQ